MPPCTSTASQFPTGGRLKTDPAESPADCPKTVEFRCGLGTEYADCSVPFIDTTIQGAFLMGGATYYIVLAVALVAAIGLFIFVKNKS